MKFQEIAKKSEKELCDLIDDLKAELFTLRFKNKTQQQDQTHKIKLVRRDIAKALTALKQQEMAKTSQKNKPSKSVKKQATSKKNETEKEGDK